MYVRMHFLLPYTSQILTLPSSPAESSRWPCSGKNLRGEGGTVGLGGAGRSGLDVHYMCPLIQPQGMQMVMGLCFPHI